MEISTILILVTAVAVLVFFLIVADALLRIDPVLESIGGHGHSYLAKLRLGLRAIERETSHLPAVAPRINEGLGSIGNGLIAVDANLHKALAALQEQHPNSDGSPS